MNEQFSPDIEQCLPCHEGCEGCSQPFDETFCLGCREGYIRNGSTCQMCDIQCLTCQSSASSCSSCPKSSSTPVLSGTSCIKECNNRYFYDSSTKLCNGCNSVCAECAGISQSQCSKCDSGKYLSGIGSGSCFPCSQTCDICYGSGSACFTCQSNQYYLSLESHTCSSACPTTNSTFTISPSHSHYICLPCHPSCERCSKHP